VDIDDGNLGPLPGHSLNVVMVPMCPQTRGTPSTRPNIEGADGADANQVFGRPRILLPSLTPQVGVAGPGGPGAVKHGGVRGGRPGKHHESKSVVEALAEKRLG
jgi:hypothetical protein